LDLRAVTISDAGVPFAEGHVVASYGKRVSEGDLVLRAFIGAVTVFRCGRPHLKASSGNDYHLRAIHCTLPEDILDFQRTLLICRQHVWANSIADIRPDYPERAPAAFEIILVH